MTMSTLPHPLRVAKPGTPVGTAVLWARKNLFSSWFNSLLTLFCLWLLWIVIPPLFNWVIFQANWVGTTRADCTKQGACWVFVHARFGQFMYGLYPFEERWRINLTLIVGLLTLIPMFVRAMPRRGRYITAWIVLFPIFTWFMLYGGFFGLPVVETRQWGGLTLTLIIAAVGIAGAGETFTVADCAHTVRHFYRVLAWCTVDHRAVYVLGDAAVVYARRHQHRQTGACAGRRGVVPVGVCGGSGAWRFAGTAERPD